MADLQTIEQRFWAKVWRCAHRYPCKKCCWPWREIDVTLNWKCVWKEHGIFSDRTLHPLTPIAAYRFAYELRVGTISFHGRSFHMCHQCHFGPCCNPWHIAPGSSSDNAKDTHHGRLPIRLPDGRVWVYAQACMNQKAFYEAYSYGRIWAGATPLYFWDMEKELYNKKKNLTWQIALHLSH